MTLTSSLLSARRTAGLTASALCLTMASAAISPAQAQDLTPVVFGTNWLAQAEHGGFYQSVADGTYAECGLDVTIIPGGPQVNNRALMLAGRMDFHMGGDMSSAFLAAEQDIPVVVVMAAFQKHPQVIIAHPGEAETWEELKDLTLLIGDNGFQGYYQWMMAEYGFTEEQRVPYTFNPAPFLADPRTGMQGYLSSEPYVIETEGGFTPQCLPHRRCRLCDLCHHHRNHGRHHRRAPRSGRVLRRGLDPRLVQLSLWRQRRGQRTDPRRQPRNEQDKIDYAIEKMLEFGIVDSGDALELGIGAMTDEKVDAFYNQLVESGVLEAGLDYSSSYTTQFVNQGLGLELRP
jgi:NitT/TauT family transport system substrate-binding protein